MSYTKKDYKYYLSLTSQLPFCSSPLRLDASNKCEFACAYCFASTRQGFGRNSKLQLTKAKILRERFIRIKKGRILGAIDEFIERKIPIQFGGMSDPFSKSPLSENITADLMNTLKEFHYPYILSTKSSAISSPAFIASLKDSNCYVRFSTTVINPTKRSAVDLGSSTFDEILRATEFIRKAGIPVCFRFQPIIPGHEEFAAEMIDRASNAGVNHISAEYLKVPIDADSKFRKVLRDLLPPKPVAYYVNRQASHQGREYILPTKYRQHHLLAMKHRANSHGITFGFADNDLLLFSEGNSCCSASDLYLKEANMFSANIVTMAKRMQIGELISLDDLRSEWIPKHPISSQLNSTSRINKSLIGSDAEWYVYLEELWEGRRGLYSPAFFEGITKSDATDNQGLALYKRIRTDLDIAIAAQMPYHPTVPEAKSAALET
ncbi:radical SAM protein [gamma proteobacterium BDW918]|uniref:Radical SAM core domain-containing protein n=1 Tax=Zhongshania aliphaticivorans TaxID=1470434 RepID=A0A127M2D3_9GAMM|nr:radical SAM protein [Zhongshania aliphaticivorans]AMO67380.1 hypothetical protein AZF00_03265 [Zhongshania aliphaticivorans]EIF42977.1 radical SAM protein [gamma proteobacterium BDW918]